MTYEEGIKLVNYCINELKTIFLISQNNFIIKCVDKVKIIWLLFYLFVFLNRKEFEKLNLKNIYNNTTKQHSVYIHDFKKTQFLKIFYKEFYFL